MTDLDKKVVDYLIDKDSKFYIDVIDPLRSGKASVVDFSNNGILVNNNGVWMVITEDKAQAVEYAHIIAQNRRPGASVVVHQNVALDEISGIIKTSWRQVPCHVAGYFLPDVLSVESDASFKPLTHDFDEVVWKTYNFFKDNPNGLIPARESIDNGMIGAFANDTLVGYIGIHEESAMGMLEVFPQYRRNGYGIALEKTLINYLLNKGRSPFCHILETNSVSIALQKRIGLWLSTDKVYWMG